MSGSSRPSPSLAIFASVAVGILVVACGGSISPVDADGGLGFEPGGPNDPSGPGRRDAGPDARAEAGSVRRDAGPDAKPPYVEPECPDAARPPPQLECDAFAPAGATGCPSDQGCYPFVQYPSGPCDPEEYGAVCAPAGPGKQGDSCQGITQCSAGFVCVISGAGTQCVKLCELSKTGTCPEGFVCEPVDVPGFGACF